MDTVQLYMHTYVSCYSIVLIITKAVAETPSLCQSSTYMYDIEVNIPEATTEDLISNPTLYEADTTINGILNGTDPLTGVSMSIFPAGPSEIDIPQNFALVRKNVTEFGLDSRAHVRLVNPIDRDGATYSIWDDLNSVEFLLICRTLTSSVAGQPTSYTSTFTITVVINDVNDNSPVVMGRPIPIQVNELTPTGIVVADLALQMTVTDKDTGPNAEFAFNIVPHKNELVDGSKHFEVRFGTEQLVLTTAVDYEIAAMYELNISISDRPLDRRKQRETFTTMLINITDADDLGPTFIYDGCFKVDDQCFNPTYITTLYTNNSVGPLTLRLASNTANIVNILAKDQDTLNNKIEFTIVETIPLGYKYAFTVSGRGLSGAYQATVSQIAAVDFSGITSNYLKIIIKATEISENRRFERAVIEARIEPYNNTGPTGVTSQETNECVNWVPVVGGILGTLLAIATVALIISHIQHKRTKKRTKSEVQREERRSHVYQNDGAENSGEITHRQTSSRYDDIGMRSPNNEYDELHSPYIEL